MQKIFNQKNLKIILVIFILLQPIFDTYILFDEKVVNIFKMSPSTIIRLIFIFIMGILSLFVIKSSRKKKWYFIYAAAVIIYSILHLYSVGNFTTLSPSDFNYSYVSEIFYIIRLIIPLVLIIISSNIEISKKELKRIFYILFLTVSGIIVVSNLFKISIGSYVTKRIEYNFIDWFTLDIYKTHSFYDTASRGYFSFANMISSLLFGFSGILFYNLLKKGNLRNFFAVILLMLSMFMLGTKIATFGFVLSLVAILIVYLYFSIFRKKIQFNYKSMLMILLIFTMWITIFPYSPCKNRMSSNIDNDSSSETIDNDIINDIKNVTGVEKEKRIKEFLIDNYDKYGLKEEYFINYYPYEYDYMFWFDMLTEDSNVKADNRLLTIKILDRMKDIDGRSINNELFGISYSRVSNIVILERDFTNQYYYLGILGSILFTLPYIVMLIYCFIKMLINREKMTFYNITILICFASSLFGAYYCGNTLDNLTFSIILAFFSGVFIRSINSSNKKLNDKKITIMALHLGYGGVEKYISSLCMMLEEDYDIEIISTYDLLQGKTAFAFSDKIKIKYLINYGPNKEELIKVIRSGNVIKIIKEGIKSIKILLLKRYRNIKVIKEIDSKYIITTRTFHNKLVGDYANKDIIKIATEHNYHNNDKKYINKVITSIKKFDYFIVVSMALEDYYKDIIGDTKCVYIPNVIDNIPNYYKHSKTNNKLISIGRLAYEKGYSDLLDVISIIKKDKEDIKLDIYGDGNLKNRLQEKIERLGLEDNVSLCGFVSQNKIFNLMKNYDIYVMSSYTESFGIVLLEAMSNSLPCVAFDSANGAKEVLKNNNGILIGDRNKEDMAKEIVKLLNNINKRNMISKKGYDNASNYYIWNVKKKWINILRKY